MATKKTNNKKLSSNELIRTCAYYALVIAAGIFLISGIFNAFEITIFQGILSVLNLIGKILLAIGLAIPAYDYTAGKPRVWRIVYWVALVVYLLGCVFGIL